MMERLFAISELCKSYIDKMDWKKCGIKLTAETVDEDPASYKRWISRKEI